MKENNIEDEQLSKAVLDEQIFELMMNWFKNHAKINNYSQKGVEEITKETKEIFDQIRMEKFIKELGAKNN